MNKVERDIMDKHLRRIIEPSSETWKYFDFSKQRWVEGYGFVDFYYVKQVVNDMIKELVNNGALEREVDFVTLEQCKAGLEEEE
jgi:hypothetical protein